ATSSTRAAPGATAATSAARTAARPAPKWISDTALRMKGVGAPLAVVRGETSDMGSCAAGKTASAISPGRKRRQALPACEARRRSVGLAGGPRPYHGRRQGAWDRHALHGLGQDGRFRRRADGSRILALLQGLARQQRAAQGFQELD